MFKLILVILTLNSVSSDLIDDTDAIIDALPEDEKKELLARIERRINEDVVPGQVNHAQSEVELPDEVLNVHSPYVNSILEQETKNLTARQLVEANKTEFSRSQPNDGNDYDLTLRSHRRNRRDEENVTAKDAETLPTGNDATTVAATTTDKIATVPSQTIAVAVVYDTSEPNARKAGILGNVTGPDTEPITESVPAAETVATVNVAINAVTPNPTAETTTPATNTTVSRRSGSVIAKNVAVEKAIADLPNDVQFQAHPNDGVIRTDVYEVDPNDPNVFGPAIPVQKPKAEVKPNAEMPFIVPERNYDPKNAYYNPRNIMGPNVNDFKNNLRIEDSPLPVSNNDNPFLALVHNYKPSNAYYRPHSVAGHETQGVQLGRYLGEDLGVLTPPTDDISQETWYYYHNRPKEDLVKDYSDLDEVVGRATPRPASLPFTLDVPVARSRAKAGGETHDIGLDYYYYNERLRDDDAVKEDLSTTRIKEEVPEEKTRLRNRIGDLSMDQWKLAQNSNFFRTRKNLTPKRFTTSIPFRPKKSLTYQDVAQKPINFEPYLTVLNDMIDSNHAALRNYKWLKSTVNIQLSLERLIELTYARNLHPYDTSLLNYARDIYSEVQSSSSLTPSQTSPQTTLHFGSLNRRFKLPRPRAPKANNKNKNQAKRPVGVVKLKKIVKNPIKMMKNLHELLGLKRSQVGNREFRQFLFTIRNGLYDLHNVIKYIASVTDFRRQRWFQDIKDLYLIKQDREELLTILLHLSAAKFLGLVDQSAKMYGTELQMDYMMSLRSHSEDLSRTKEELRFLLSILNELKNV